MTIRIDQLNQTVNPARDHEFPAMRDGETVKLRAEQVLAVGNASDPQALKDFSNVDPATGRAALNTPNVNDLGSAAQADIGTGPDQVSPNSLIPLPMAKAPSNLEWLSTNSIRVTAGSFRSEDDSSNIVLPSDIDITGISVGNNAHRHVLAGRDGSGDPAAILSETIALPSGWQAFRRVGSVRTDGSGDVRSFIQHGDVFMLAEPIAGAVNVSNQGTNEVTRTLPVPLGVRVLAVLDVAASRSEAFALAVVGGDTSSFAPDFPQQGSVSPATISARSSANQEPAAGSTEAQVLTNTSGQIKTRSSISSTNVNITVKGWIDARGRNR